MDDFIVPFMLSFAIACLFIYSIISSQNKGKGDDGIVCMKTLPFLGHLHYLFKPSRKGADRMTSLVHLATSMGKLFKNEDMFYIKLAHKKVLVLTTADSAEVLLTNREELNKPNFYDPLRTSLGNSLIVTRGDDHYMKRRKILGEIFHNKNIAALDANMTRHAISEINKINQLDDLSQVDISEHISKFTFKNALDVALKSQLKENVVDEMLDLCERYQEIFGYRVSEPWMHSDTLFNLTPLAKENQEIFKNMFKYLKDLSESNYQTEHEFSSAFDLMQKFPQKKKYWNTVEDEVHDVFNIIFATFDTARNTLEWAAFLVGHHPRVQEKIYQELMEVVGKDEEQLTWENISKLKYLKCVIKEALRLFPPGPVIGRCLKKDLNIKGKTVPKGTDVAVFISFIQRSERHFKNPDLFIPERFESDDIPTFAFIPFSYGLRNCVGPAFGYKIMLTMMAHLCYRFIFKSVDREDSIFTKTSMTQRVHKPILLQMKYR